MRAAVDVTTRLAAAYTMATSARKAAQDTLVGFSHTDEKPSRAGSGGWLALRSWWTQTSGQPRSTLARSALLLTRGRSIIAVTRTTVSENRRVTKVPNATGARQRG